VLYISGRERKIVEILLQANEVVTVKQLADQLKVSSRTIHRDLKNVEEILGTYQLILTRKSGSGLTVSGEIADFEALRARLKYAKNTDYRPEERQAVILLTLLSANGPLKLFNLASELQVTIATISNDLDDIQKVLDKYRLSLIRRRGYGVEMSGAEKDKRALLSQLMADHLDEFHFYSLLKDDSSWKVTDNIGMISDRLLGIVKQEKLQIIEQEVEKAKAILPYELADSAYMGLIVHLALAIERLEQGDTIQFDVDYLQQIQETNEYAIARTMTENLEEALQMQIPEDEIGYITMHLMGAKLKVNHEHLIKEANIDIAYHAKQLINYVSRTLNIDLKDNERLLHDLVAHLKPTMYRLQQHMPIKNPLLDEIMVDYQELFDVIQDSVKEVFPELDIPKEEIGYLVLHFGAVLIQSQADLELRALVICPSGIGTAKMLGERLLQKVPEIKEIENKSIFDLNHMLKHEYDLIVSTIPLQGNIDYILASPILPKRDVDQINQVVRRKKVKQSVVRKQKTVNDEPSVVDRLQALQNYSKAMLAILDNFYVQMIDKDGSMPEIIAYICEELKNKNVIADKEQVLNDLLAREKVAGLGIPGTSIALYHTRSYGVREVSFSVYHLSNPHAIQGMDGQSQEIERILLMIAPKDIHQQALEILSLMSSLLISDEQAILLFETGTESEIHSFISKHLNDFMSERL